MNTDFFKIIREHKDRYPAMTAQDFVKLAYQSEFGPRHLSATHAAIRNYLEQEWNCVDELRPEAHVESIGNGLSRFYLRQERPDGTADLLVHLFLKTMALHTGTKDGFLSRLKLLAAEVPGMDALVEQYRLSEPQPVSHSQIYRDHYQPHYRLLRKEYAAWFFPLLKIWNFLQTDKTVIIAIDGCCGSGKSTFAEVIQQVFPCNVFHMDDYYLPLNRRDPSWKEIPAGNMDIERFRNEVLIPAASNTDISYRPYHCQSGTYAEPTVIPASKLTIIEGSYSQHPELAKFYDCKIFLTCADATQRSRLQIREGDYFPVFEKLWMLLEKRYHEAFQIPEQADVVFHTDDWFAREYK